MTNLISQRLSERQLKLLSQHQQGNESQGQTAKRLLIETLEESDLPYREVLRVVLEGIQSTNHNVAVVAERIDILAENQVAIDAERVSGEANRLDFTINRHGYGDRFASPQIHHPQFHPWRISSALTFSNPV